VTTSDAGTSYGTVSERIERGRDARRVSSRGEHARFEAPPARPDPVEVLRQQAATRVRELLPIRYGRMSSSPFAFYRGAAATMAADLAGAPHTGLTTQLCGDAHLSNFGIFASPERRLVFDINDFDETFPGPFEWDVKRLVASFAIAGRHRGMTADDRSKLIELVARTYHAHFCRAIEPEGLVRPSAGRGTRRSAPLPRRQDGRATGGRTREGAGQGQSPGIGEVDHRRRRASQNRGGPAPHRSRRGPSRVRTEGGPTGHHRYPRRIREHALARTCPPAVAVPLRPRRPQGGWCGQASAPERSSCCSRAGTAATPCSCR
jgi:hypothetical protein